MIQPFYLNLDLWINDIPHINFDSIFAGIITNQTIHVKIPLAFSQASTMTYVFNSTNIINALDEIINDVKDVIVIAMNVEYDVKLALEDSRFIDSVKFINTVPYELSGVVFVLRLKDCPTIEYVDNVNNHDRLQNLIKIDDKVKYLFFCFRYK